jgi:hypothetical protein
LAHALVLNSPIELVWVLGVGAENDSNESTSMVPTVTLPEIELVNHLLALAGAWLES